MNQANAVPTRTSTVRTPLLTFLLTVMTAMYITRNRPLQSLRFFIPTQTTVCFGRSPTRLGRASRSRYRLRLGRPRYEWCARRCFAVFVFFELNICAVVKGEFQQAVRAVQVQFVADVLAMVVHRAHA